MSDGTGHAGVDVYDTTLRDGTQREGITLTVADKLEVARRLDALGVHFIEGGWPGANPRDTEFFRRVADGALPLKTATLTAFGATRRVANAVEDDPTLTALLEAGTEVVCIVGKSCRDHAERALRVAPADNLAMVEDSVAYLVAAGRRVVFDAEHFFDGYARDPAYALDVVRVAAAAGATCVVLCDTNGGAMPWTVERVVREAVAELPVQVGGHFHDDAGCAVANTLVAVRAGATHVQGTANGIGERCGNANLFTVVADLQLKAGLPLIPADGLAQLTDTAHAIAELCNQPPPAAQPYVGSGSFAHKAGLHASAVARSSDLYEHVEPGLVGNRQRLVVSDLAGRATIVLKARAAGIELDQRVAGEVLDLVKQREHEGWTYDAADASFELLLRRHAGGIDEPFRVEHFRVTTRSGVAGASAAEAVVAVEVGGERRLGAGEGNGPVDALDHAFRNAANGRLSVLDRVELVDYRVRILETSRGTGAVTRVLLTATDGHETWNTVGVHANVVEASWRALADAYTYALLRAARLRSH